MTTIGHAVFRATLVAFALGAASMLAAQSPTADIQDIEIQRGLAHARAERWSRMLVTQERLAKQPGAYAALAESAASDLKRSGTELILEGTTLGLSSYFKLEAFYAKDSPEAEKRFRQAATLVNGVWKGYGKQQLAVPGAQPWRPEDQVAQVNAVLQMGVEVLPVDKPTRALLQATMDLGRSGTFWLGAYASGDQRKAEEHLQAIQALLQGTRGMLYAWGVTTKRQDWVSKSQVLSRRYPLFGKVAERMTTVGLAEFNLALAAANLGFGCYAWQTGFDLEQQAATIRADQSRALAVLTRLVPKARAELAEAQREVRRLDEALRAAHGVELPPVVPSKRFFDDGMGIPQPPARLPSAGSLVARIPPLNIELTEEAKARIEREAEARRTAARAAARAEAATQYEYAESRDRSHSSSSDGWSSSSNSSSSSATTVDSSSAPSSGSGSNSKTQSAAANAKQIIRELNQQGRGSGLGEIKGGD